MDDKEREYKMLLIKIKQIREIIAIKGIASNTKVSMIEDIVREKDE